MKHPNDTFAHSSVFTIQVSSVFSSVFSVQFSVYFTVYTMSKAVWCNSVLHTAVNSVLHTAVNYHKYYFNFSEKGARGYHRNVWPLPLDFPQYAVFYAGTKIGLI